MATLRDIEIDSKFREVKDELDTINGKIDLIMEHLGVAPAQGPQLLAAPPPRRKAGGR